MLYIHGVGHFHPENVIDNEFLENLDIGTNEAWILERVGIKTRHTVLSLDYIKDTRNQDPRAAAEASLYSNRQTGALAAKLALQRAGLKPADIGMVIAGGCSPQWSIPAEACLIAAELNIDALGVDLNSACSTFAAQMHFLNSMNPESMPDYILLVNPDNNTRTVNYNDRRTSILWGDGSAATIVSTKLKSRARLNFTMMQSNPQGWNKVVIQVARHFEQDGPAVQSFAIRTTVATLQDLKPHVKCALPDMFFIGHQANLLMLQTSCQRAAINPLKHFYNIDNFGNCGAAGAPSVLSQRWDDFQAGDELSLVTVGSGLSWGGMVIEFS